MDKITTLQKNKANPVKEVKDIQNQLNIVREQLQKKNIEQMAIRTLSEELTHVLDLGEAVDVVNKYLWELLDYSVATYIVYNIQEARFEARAYLKETVSSKFISDVFVQVKDFMKEHSHEAIVGSVASATGGLAPLIFGVGTNEFDTSELGSSFITPLKVGGKIVGALIVTSTKKDLYTTENFSLVEMLVGVASVSVARIHTLVQSMHSSTESLVQSISDGVVMFDVDRQVTLANEAVMKFTGLPKEGYRLEELARLFTDIDLLDFVDKALSKNIDVIVPRTQISRFWYELAVLPVKNYRGRIIGGAVVLHDITTIVEIDRAKTEFVSLASHQLRTPLAAIRWYTEMLMTDSFEGLDEEQKSFVEVIYASNQKMISLVNALLNVSRIEMGTFSIDPKEVNLIEITEGIITELAPSIKDKNLKIERSFQENLPMMLADPDLASIIIQNLLSNAVKYTPNKGTVEVILRTNDTHFIIEVKDNGYGIPQSQQQELFSKLFRADNVKTKDTQGTGLGLYIVKSILEAVDGTISFTSEEDKGSVFTVTVPLSGMTSREGTKTLETQIM